ncbi:exodeoxyribonuclease VII small subunit [Campylobacter sp.]|uniref:exodeoxyribonuclease VII small subunit n=1 Tax=Campylobacter sp. TaxID=205 RepID=UPI00270528B9|nr:exodeoxyribonuclease VII small subunit [Campylobacter sp.]
MQNDENLKEDNFESKLIKANEILERLNKEELSLEQSVKLHKEGKKLLEEAAEILQNAKLQIKEIADE